jgi:serine/threonine-protein kinase HipA
MLGANTAPRPTRTAHNSGGAIAFNILISNTEDHLRNHGFLCERAAGWRLSPTHKLSPTHNMNSLRLGIKPRDLTTAVGAADGRASLDLAYEVALHLG